jgi:glycosyl transferase family 25
LTRFGCRNKVCVPDEILNPSKLIGGNRCADSVLAARQDTLEMKRIIEYFDAAYVINLTDRADRRRQAEREFRRIGLDIPSERLKFFTAVRPTDRGNFQNIGTRGCFNSHRSVLELADRHHLRNVLVFEDDFSLRHVDSSFEERLVAQLDRDDWDVVFFGYLKPNDEALAGPMLRWQDDVLGSHFYGVNGKFVRTVLQYMNDCEKRPRDHPDGGPMPADGIYNHIRYIKPDINLFLSVPSLAHQRSSRTDIADTHPLDKIVWLRPFIYILRTLKHRHRMITDQYKLPRE